MHHYEVYRDGVLIAQVTDLSALQYVDVELANGTYTYTVVAVDHVGNKSEVSNRVTVTIAMPPPAAPRHLAVVDTATGGTLSLTWDIAPTESPARFRVLRSDHPGGPYTLIGETVAQTWLNTGLHNGSTYYYVVLALDTLGNASDFSPEAQAVPHDRSAPDAPVLHFPTVAGQVWVSHEPQATVIGMAEPGARIQLMVNGQQVAVTQAQAALQVLEKVLPDTYLHGLSPDGRSVAYLSYQDDILRLYDYDTDAVLEVTAVAGTNYLRWAPDSASLLFSDFSRTSGHTLIRQYVLAEKRLTALTDPATMDITAAALSPDGRYLVISGSAGEGSGLWRQDVATGTYHQLVTTSFAWEIQGNSLQWSPDGTSIAYLRGAETCEIVHVPTGSIQSIANVDPASVPQWAPDGQSLLYVSRDPAEQIRQYVLSTATTQDLATGLAPQWRRDGQGIMYVDPTTTALLHTELATATTTTLLHSTRLLPATLQVVSYGWIGILNQKSFGAETYHRLSLAGRFVVPNVRLDVEDNMITATARDTAGNSSAASPGMVLTYVPGEQADLTLTEDSIIVLPATPGTGERTRVTVIVHNRGTQASTATTVSLVAIAPDSMASVLLDGVPLAPLAVGNSHALTADWTVPVQPGQYTLVAVVDPDNTVAESQESNNVVLKAVLVPSGALPAVAVRTDALVYHSHDTVTATVRMTNAGAPWSGRIVMTVADTAGFVMQTLRQEEITALPYGANLEMIATWQVGTTFAGTYQIVARLLDLQGSVVASASAPFRIAETAAMTTSVSSDRLAYTANTPARVNGTVAYTVGNHVLSGVAARLRIRHASGDLLAEHTTMLGDLVPGSTATVRLDWNTAVYAVGAYQLQLDVTQDGQLLSQATGQFTTVSSGPQLSGRLSLSAMTPTFGDIQTVTYTVTNHGNVALVQQPLRLSLVDVLSGLTLHEQHISVAVAVAQHVTGAVDIATTSLAVQSYTVLLQAVADNGSGGTTLRPLASQTFSVMDRSAPVVAIVAPTHHGFSNGSGVVTMTVQDALSAVARVEFQIDGGPWQLAILQDAATGRYSAVLPQLSKGFYIVQARAIDAFNNAGLSLVVGFTVDTTPPVITIQGVEDNTVYHSVPYTYEVEASDADGDTLRYALSSAPAGMTIDAATGDIAWWPQQPGTYTVTVHVSDPHSASDTQTYTVTVTVPNEVPAITSTPGTEAVVQQPYIYVVEAFDPNGDPLTYSLDAAPTGMHIDAVTGVVTWQPETAGEVVVSLRVTDPYGAATPQQYTLRVSATP